jgi:Rps23 Pro-64 3,4-dihydroxylase Tpa1-like proline 4-hydroxylase
MKAKQVLDAFSETLMQDERILSSRERELLTSLLHNSKAISNSNPEIQSAVSAAIARSVGETVAQRAFSLLGGSIVEQILAGSGVAGRTQDAVYDGAVEVMSPSSPIPPNPTPSAPQPPSSSPIPPNVSPIPPNASPIPPNAKTRNVSVQQSMQEVQHSRSATGILEQPEIARAQSVVLDEFLAPQELNELMDFVLEHESAFQNSEVISPAGEMGVVDYTHRRSRVLMDLGRHEQVILDRIHHVLPPVLSRLGIEEFPVTHTEAQITASNDGDFFAAHSDDGDAKIASRHLTFVYFFHREPRQFEGGDLLLHDTRRGNDRLIKTGSYQSISPQQNQIVFFPCSRLHEITPVNCPSRAFADSRFTLNGWLHK